MTFRRAVEERVENETNSEILFDPTGINGGTARRFASASIFFGEAGETGAPKHPPNPARPLSRIHPRFGDGPAEPGSAVPGKEPKAASTNRCSHRPAAVETNERGRA